MAEALPLPLSCVTSCDLVGKSLSFPYLKHGMMVVFSSQGVVGATRDCAQCLTRRECLIYFEKELFAGLGTRE